MSKFSERLIQLRKDKELTQSELARALDVGNSTIAMWETGKRTPSYSGYEEIADYFNVDMDYLLGKQDAENRYQELIKAIEQGQLIGQIASDKELLAKIEMLLALSKDKQDIVFNQIEFLYNQKWFF